MAEKFVDYPLMQPLSKTLTMLEPHVEGDAASITMMEWKAIAEGRSKLENWALCSLFVAVNTMCIFKEGFKMTEDICKERLGFIIATYADQVDRQKRILLTMGCTIDDDKLLQVIAAANREDEEIHAIIDHLTVTETEACELMIAFFKTLSGRLRLDAIEMIQRWPEFERLRMIKNSIG
jgi:hypothetical protein